MKPVNIVLETQRDRIKDIGTVLDELLTQSSMITGDDYYSGCNITVSLTIESHKIVQSRAVYGIWPGGNDV